MAKRILVVDDDIAVRNSFKLALEDTGYDLDLAETGEKGLEMAGANKYDMIYLDLRLPGKSGVEVLHEIRKRDAATPIYIITAFHKDYFEELKQSQQEGIVFELLKKPVDGDQIVQLTESILEMSGGEQ